MYTYIFMKYLCIHIYTCNHIHIYVSAYIYVYTYICICVCIYMINVHTYVCVHRCVKASNPTFSHPHQYAVLPAAVGDLACIFSVILKEMWRVVK